MSVRAGLYLRISDIGYEDEETQTATKRQREDCLKFAESRGLNVADVFEDIDLSAFKRSVKRPQFDRMIDAVRTKQIDAVIAYHIDRLTRHRSPFSRLMDACEDTGAFILTVTDGVDTRTNAGQFIADVLVGHARMSSADTARRVARKHLEMAREGRPQHGGRRLFGYTQDRMRTIPEEAALIQEAAQRIFAGESRRSICSDWDKRGVRTTTGRYFELSTLKRLLASAALSGQREHRGVLSPGIWPAIITPDETRRLRALLNQHGAQGVRARKYLLAGFMYCGICGNRLNTLSKPGRYACVRRPGRTSCGKIARLASRVDGFVTGAISIALDGVDLAEHIQRPSDGMGETVGAVADDERALEQLSRDYYVDHLIERAEFFSAREALQPRIETNKRKLAQANGHEMLGGFIGAGEEVSKQWDKKDLHWRRSIVGALIERIDVMPAVKGRTTFDPTLIDIRWKF